MGNHPTRRHRDRTNKRKRSTNENGREQLAPPPTSAAFNADISTSEAGAAGINKSTSFNPDSVPDVSNLLANLASDDDLTDLKN